MPTTYTGDADPYFRWKQLQGWQQQLQQIGDTVKSRREDRITNEAMAAIESISRGETPPDSAQVDELLQRARKALPAHEYQQINQGFSQALARYKVRESINAAKPMAQGARPQGKESLVDMLKAAGGVKSPAGPRSAATEEADAMGKQAQEYLKIFQPGPDYDASTALRPPDQFGDFGEMLKATIAQTDDPAGFILMLMQSGLGGLLDMAAMTEAQKSSAAVTTRGQDINRDLGWGRIEEGKRQFGLSHGLREEELKQRQAEARNLNTYRQSSLALEERALNDAQTARVHDRMFRVLFPTGASKASGGPEPAKIKSLGVAVDLTDIAARIAKNKGLKMSVDEVSNKMLADLQGTIDALAAKNPGWTTTQLNEGALQIIANRLIDAGADRNEVLRILTGNQEQNERDPRDLRLQEQAQRGFK